MLGTTKLIYTDTFAVHMFIRDERARFLCLHLLSLNIVLWYGKIGAYKNLSITLLLLCKLGFD